MPAFDDQLTKVQTALNVLNAEVSEFYAIGKTMVNNTEVAKANIVDVPLPDVADAPKNLEEAQALYEKSQADYNQLQLDYERDRANTDPSIGLSLLIKMREAGAYLAHFQSGRV